VLFGITLAAGTYGCWVALLPAAISAAGAVTSTAVNGVAGAVVAAHGGTAQSEEVEEKHEDEMERKDRCDDLEMEGPSVIEIHKGAGGSEYRELQLAGPIDRMKWTPVIDKDTNANGWRPAVNFLQMNFTPPLGALPEQGSDYLAYAPINGEASTAADRSDSLTSNFGANTGTFEWKGRQYRFVLAHELPCFPPPP
jgi:hypothetical protein